MAVPKTEAQPVAAPTRVGLIDRFSVVLIAVAAMLWASDTYFRAQLIGHQPVPPHLAVVKTNGPGNKRNRFHRVGNIFVIAGLVLARRFKRQPEFGGEINWAGPGQP